VGLARGRAGLGEAPRHGPVTGFAKTATVGHVLTANPSHLELRIFHALNFDAGPLVDTVARVLSSRGFGFAVAALILAIGLASVRWTSLVVALVTAVTISDGIGSHLLKPWFARRRPCYALDPSMVRWLGAAADVGSMPSLHAANFFALAVLTLAVDRRLAPPVFVLAVAVALSRVYLGVHWPWDVVVGACWGAIAGGIAAVALRRLERRGRGGAGSPPARS
jgi:undecaprenyl-diphosphatase